MKNRFEINGDVTTIYLESKKFGVKETIISTESLPKAMEFNGKWSLSYNRKNHLFYVQGKVSRNGKTLTTYLHRHLTSAPKGKVVDHINHDTLDNTIKNLRVVTHGQNKQNVGVRKDSLVGFRGVTFIKKEKKFQARVKVNGVSKSLGFFDSAEEAAAAAEKERLSAMPFSNEDYVKKTEFSNKRIS